MHKIPNEILTLQRGQELIALNAGFVNPVYFPKGGTEVIGILEKLRSNGHFTQESVRQSCPPQLFDFFLEHSLIVPVQENIAISENHCCECECAGKSHSRSVYLLLSHSCNQKCIYCLNGRETYQTEHRNMMTEEVAYKAVETMFQSISQNGNLEIIFFGGEPLLNWALAKKVITYCEKVLKPKAPEKKIHYHLTTNLTIFPDDLIKHSLKYNITFLVNIDGPEEIHDATRPFQSGRGSFQTSVKNIARLKENGISVALRATITSHNHDALMEIAQTHKEIGGESCAFVPLNPIDSDEIAIPFDLCPSPEKVGEGLKEVYQSGLWEPERLYPFNEYLGRLVPGYSNTWACGAPHGNTPVISADGKIFSCIYLVGISKFQVGDLFEGDFPRKQVVDEMLDTANVNNSAICKECGFRNLCGGGCPVGRFTIAGNPDVSDEVKRYTEEIACVTSKTVLTELLWDLAKKRNYTGGSAKPCSRAGAR